MGAADRRLTASSLSCSYGQLPPSAAERREDYCEAVRDFWMSVGEVIDEKSSI